MQGINPVSSKPFSYNISCSGCWLGSPHAETLPEAALPCWDVVLVALLGCTVGLV